MNNLRPLPFALEPQSQDMQDTAASPAPSRRQLQRRAPAPLALEQRVMFDGATVDAVVRAAAPVPAAADGVPAGEGERSMEPAALAPAVRSVQAEARREVVFIEDNLPDYLKLAQGARAGAEVIVLDHTRDGLQQMIAALQGRQVDAIHLVTHGANGQIDLGSSRLSVSNVDALAGQLAELGQSLSADGDLLLYGCDVAGGAGGAGGAGNDFLARLAQHTGADVAASIDTTGSTGFGNWTLEAHDGSIETASMALDGAGWQGAMVTTVFDAQQRQLVFNGAVAEKSGSTGTNDGDKMRFKSVITINGQAIDAIVTTTLDRITVSNFDSPNQPGNAAEAVDYFQPLTKITSQGGSVTFQFDFVLAGTTTAVTLQNFVVNSYDIDSSGSNRNDRQFQEFKGFARYELAKSTQLTPTVRNDGSVTFEYNAASSINYQGSLYGDDYRVQVYYDSASSLVVRSGANGYQGSTFANADAHFSLEFKIRAWGGPTDIVGSPAPIVSYGSTVFREAAANDGSIAATSTITLTNGTFSGTNGQSLAGVTFANLPAGLSATVTRLSDTTASLSFSGKANAHANANDVSNFGISFGNAAFASGNAGAVTGASRGDLVIDFEDGDLIAPVVNAGQRFAYAENQAVNAVIGTVQASDAVGVTGFRFADSQDSQSADGRFTIDARGTIRMTEAGTRSASNDFDVLPNGFTYAVQARDAAGNWSVSQNVALDVTNIDEVAPVFASPARATADENQSKLYTAQASDAVDFTDKVVSYALASGGDAALLRIDGATGVVSLATGTLDFETKGSYTFTVVAKDATGNAREHAVTVDVNNIDEVAPVFTSGTRASVDENQSKLYTAQATDKVDFTDKVITYTLADGGDAGLLKIDGATGVVTLADGQLDFETKDGYSFTVVATDASGNAIEQSVTVTVANLDDHAPVFTSGITGSVSENQDLLYTAQAQDSIDFTDKVVEYALAAGGDAALLKIDATTGAVRLADGKLDFETKNRYSFTVIAQDASGNASRQAVTIDVANIDEVAPAFTSGTHATVDENQDLLYTAQANDKVDFTDRKVTYALAARGDAALLRIDSVSGAVHLAAGQLDFESKARYTFTVLASDASGNTREQNVVVDVTDLNEAPVAADASVTTGEDTPLAGKLPGYQDPDGDLATYLGVTAPQHGSVDIAPDGSYTYTPARDFHGADSFTYAIDDGRGGRNVYRVDITVTPVNDAPVAGPDTIHTSEDTPIKGRLPAATDVEGDPVKYSVHTGPAKGELVLGSDGSYTYTPYPDANGSDSFRYTVSDGQGGSNTYTVEITVKPVNDAPVASPAVSGAAQLGEPMAPIQVAPFSDIDSPTLAYEATLADGSALPSWLKFDPATLGFTGTPSAGALGTIDIVVSGSDGQLSATTTVTIAVGNPVRPAQSATIDLMTRDSGSSQSDFITADGGAGRTVSGTIDAPLGRNEVLEVSFDGGASWTEATVDGGRWQAVDGGAHGASWEIVTRVTNSVAGLSGIETTRAVTLDRDAPRAPTVDSISTGSTTPTLGGTATVQTGETLRVEVNGKSYTVPVQDGRWTLDLASASPAAQLVEGRSYDVVATVTDAAGNSRSGDTGVVRISAPVVPLVPQPLPPAVVPVAEVPLPAPVAAPVAEPVPLPVVRDSVVPGSMVGGDAMLLSTGLGSRPAANDVANALRGVAELSDVYTRSEGFRTVVATADEPALLRFQGVPDQFVDSGARISLTVPADAFTHTQPKAVVRLAAVLQDGRPLPNWVQFNGQTGQFTGEVPQGLAGELKIKLIARDTNGREAVALFRINVGEDVKGAKGDKGDSAASGKPGLSERMKATQGAKAAMLRGRP